MIDVAIAQLKQINASMDRHPELKELVQARDEVFKRYQPIFSAEALPSLTADDFQSFLLFKNNRHWTGLHRLGPLICKNMAGLRAALLGFHDASLPIETRFDKAMALKYVAEGILSAVLHVMYPDDFGVWNKTSAGGLKHLGVRLEFDRGASPGRRYRAINSVLHQLKDGVGVDLWTLDALLWAAIKRVDTGVSDRGTDFEPVAEGEPDETQRFGLEKYLHEFLLDNWDATELGKDWEIYSEAGEEYAGFKYECGSIGQIDILARRKSGHDWLVVELKRDRSGDATVGQLLRYMGFVKHSLAKDMGRVFGLIIARTLDEKLHYAVCDLQNVAVHTYAIDFKLAPPTTDSYKLPFKLPTLRDLLATGNPSCGAT